MDAVVAAVNVMEGEWHLRKEKLKPILTSVLYSFQTILFSSGKGAVSSSAGFVGAIRLHMMWVRMMTYSSRRVNSHPHISPSRRTFASTLLKWTPNPSQLARALYLSPAATLHPFPSCTPARGP